MTAFVSTRRRSRPVSFEEALTSGLAPDGGLYLPERIPAWDPSLWTSDLPFPERATLALETWLEGSVGSNAVGAIVESALDFPVPLVDLGSMSPAWIDTYVLELFHGPTLSFKDFGARVMARLMAHVMSEKGSAALTILVATSGDTGSAVADGFSGLPNLRVVLLYPKGQVSRLQERQLIVRRPGVRAFAVNGTFDDCQRLVKDTFSDPDLTHLQISSANSINVGRLLPQALYYLHAESLMTRPPVFCTPSGNLGNLTAGLLAAKAGLPVRHFIAAHNANAFFPEYLRSSDASFRPSIRTLSNAMDVGAPSNFERLITLHDHESLRRIIWGTSVSDSETRKSMLRVYQTTGYVCDPHTAVGLEATRRYRTITGYDGPVIVLSTAHPAKFPETVADTLHVDPPHAKRLDELASLPTRVESLEAEKSALRSVLLDQT